MEEEKDGELHVGLITGNEDLRCGITGSLKEGLSHRSRTHLIQTSISFKTPDLKEKSFQDD